MLLIAATGEAKLAVNAYVARQIQPFDLAQLRQCFRILEAPRSQIEIMQRLVLRDQPCIEGIGIHRPDGQETESRQS